MRLLWVGLLLAVGTVRLGAQAPEAGVSRGLAVARAARVSDLRYGLRFVVAAKAPTTSGQETVTFTDGGTGDLAIDFRDGVIAAAELNGHALPTAEVNGHLILPAALLGKTNTLKTTFTANVAAAGKAITRYADKDDGSEYLYTLFVPMDADMAFPCFDQPDLKARFTLAVEHPREWVVVGNTAAARGSATVTSFEETRPISTYLFAFAAGPFARVEGAHAGEPAVYVRRSQLARARQEAPAVQAITARGIAWLSDYFQQPFPFPKYDLVLIPGFPFGGMEHAGATFLNEDGVLFRSTPTDSDRFRRDTLVLHETTHQWFGDLVTMRWFDDLWLKEGFAQYMAYKALAALEPGMQPWKHFYEDIKPLAYGIDETQGTTPIFQDIPNLKDAKSAYGAIVYQKAPAVLKQLDYKLAGDTFRDGLRIYLKQHAYANATWPDLIHAFEQAGGKDVQTWADAWITRRGMPQVDVAFTCDKGMIASVTLKQQDVLPDGYIWPMATQLRMVYPAVFSRSHDTLRVDWHGPDHIVKRAVGRPCPAYIFANDDDEAYGRFLLDAESERLVRKALEAEQDGVMHEDLLAHSMLWGALWDNVRATRMAPRNYAELALATLPRESDEALNRIQGGRIATALHLYMGTKSRDALTPRAEEVLADRMMHAPTLDVRIVSFRSFTNVAATPGGMARLKALLGEAAVPGLTLKPLDRWNMIGHLVAMNDSQAAALYAAEAKRDTSGEGLKYAYAMGAGKPDAATKARYFADYVNTSSDAAARQEDWLTQSLGPFNSWNQHALTEPYLLPALNELAEIKHKRKIFFLGAWLGAFVNGQSTPVAQAIVHAWLASKSIEPDLRLKVLEASDALDRTVKIRARWPE